MARRIIHIHYLECGKLLVEICNDWFDVADWIKERSVNGKITSIVDWGYENG